MKLITTGILILFAAITVGCGATAKNTVSITPAVNTQGNWTITATEYEASAPSVLQVDLVTTSCTTALTFQEQGGPVTLSPTINAQGAGEPPALCVVADNLLPASGSVTGASGYFYYPPVAVIMSSQSPTVTSEPINLTFIETDQSGDYAEFLAYGTATLDTATGNDVLNGVFMCLSGACAGTASGTWTAVHQ
jgi:hypothetical protein